MQAAEGDITTDPVHVIGGRYAQPAGQGGLVRNPARDTLSGGLVTVLRRAAPADPLVRSRELDRLRRYAATRRPHLAGVRAVEVCGGELVVICEPVAGHLLGDASPPAGVTVEDIRGIAVDLLDALAQLHLAGIAHGRVTGSVLLSAGSAGSTVTLLPLPLVWPSGLSPSSADDDRRQACALLLDLLHAVPTAESRDEVVARDLAEALERVGGLREEPRTSWEREAGATTAAALPLPVPLTLSPSSLAPLGPRAAAGEAAAGPLPPAPVDRPEGRTRRRRRRGARGVVVAVVALVVAAVLIAALAAAGQQGGRPGDVPSVVTDSPSSAASPGSAPPSPWDLPTTLPGLVDTLTAHPDAAGPSGAALLDALRGLRSGDGAVARRAATELMSLVLDDDRLDSRYAAASLAALATGSIPSAPGAPAACVGVVPAPPDPTVQQYAQQVLGRLPKWQGEGLPTAQAERLRELASPVAAAEGAPALTPCTSG